MLEQSLKGCNTTDEQQHFVNLLYEIILQGKISNMFEIERLLPQLYTEEYKDPKINLLMTYIYFNMLNKEQQLIFAQSKAHVIRVLAEQLALYTDPAVVSGIYQNEYKEAFIEEKYLHLLTTEIFCKYSNKEYETMGIEHFPVEKINILVNSLYSTNFCKFNDAFLYAFMIWKGLYNYEYDNISDYTKDLLDLLLINQIYGLLSNVSKTDEQQQQCNFEDQFYNMRLK